MLNTALSFFVCGLGQIVSGKVRRGVIFFVTFASSLSISLYRFLQDDIATRLTVWDNKEIRISYFYIFLTFLIWLYNVIDSFEPVKKTVIDPDVDYYDKGRMSSLNGDYDEAAENFATALKVNPKDTDALFQLGRAFYQLGSVTKARDVFEKYLATGDKKWKEEVFKLTKQEVVK